MHTPYTAIALPMLLWSIISASIGVDHTLKVKCCKCCVDDELVYNIIEVYKHWHIMLA